MTEFNELLERVCKIDSMEREENSEYGLEWLVSKCDLSDIKDDEKNYLVELFKKYIKFNIKYMKEIQISYIKSNQQNINKARKKRNKIYKEIYSSLFKYIVEPLHDLWRQYTEEEIENTYNKCSKCLYSSKNVQVSVGRILGCNYLYRTGNIRDCRPEICDKFVNEEDVPSKKPSVYGKF